MFLLEISRLQIILFLVLS